MGLRGTGACFSVSQLTEEFSSPHLVPGRGLVLDSILSTSVPLTHVHFSHLDHLVS